MARGAVYILVGGLALAAAAGAGGKPTDPSGALSTLVRCPPAGPRLALIAVGLLVHAAFQAALVLTGEPYVKQGPGGAPRRASGTPSAPVFMRAWR